MEGDKKPRVSNLTKKILWAVVAVAAAAALFFAGYYTYYLSLGEGFRSLLWVKNMIQDEYYREISDDDFWQAAIDGAIAGLDQYSAYYTDEEYDTVTDENLGLRAGIGVSFFAGSNKISKVAIGSPVFFAQQNTDLAGAWVTGVGGSESEIADTFTSAALAKEMAKYGEGDTVVVRVSEKGANDKDTVTCRTLSVVSAAYHESYVLYAGRTDDGQARAFAVIYGEDGEGAWTDVSAYTAADEKVPAGQAYLRLVQFNGGASDEFAQAAGQYKEDGLRTLLLDLRNNGGGRLDILQRIAPYFIANTDDARAVIMRARYRSGEEAVSRAVGNKYGEYFAGSEIYVAANGNTASASEALIGAMIDYGAIGFEDIYITDTVQKEGYAAATYGKGIMQSTYVNTKTGEAIKLTTAQIYWPNGRTIHDVGITVNDGAIASPAASFGEYGDAELESIFGYISARTA